jgi:hypothetical protein
MALPEQTIRFTAPEVNGAFYMDDGDLTRLQTWAMHGELVPPVHIDALMDVVGQALPNGSEKPLQGYRVSAVPVTIGPPEQSANHASDAEADVDMVSRFAVDYLLWRQGFDLSGDTEARRHLAEDIAPAVAAALSARLIWV